MNNKNNQDQTTFIDKVEPGSDTAIVQTHKEVAEIQAMVFMAKKFPRDIEKSQEDIVGICKNINLALVSTYSYPRADTIVHGASIRLAEALGYCWGNVKYGLRELKRDEEKHESEVLAYAWDVEKNMYVDRLFKVDHYRHTRERTYLLTTERDIYEKIANYGARRLRACILQIIPGFYVDIALDQCDKTLQDTIDANRDKYIQELVEKFEREDISVEVLEKKYKKKLNDLTRKEIMNLTKLYNAIRDKIVKPSDFFDVPDQTAIDQETSELQTRIEKHNKENGQKKEQSESAKNDKEPEKSEKEKPVPPPSTELKEDEQPEKTPPPSKPEMATKDYCNLINEMYVKRVNSLKQNKVASLKDLLMIYRIEKLTPESMTKEQYNQIKRMLEQTPLDKREKK